MSKQLNRLIIKGGVLSPGELKYICDSMESLGVKTISFGSRQDILLPKKLIIDNKYRLTLDNETDLKFFRKLFSNFVK